MPEVEDILAKMRDAPESVRFSEACRVATAYFGLPRQNGTSRKVWKMPWAGDPRVNLQKGDGGQAKSYQVKQLLRAIDRLVEEKNRREI